jgi:thymidylate synthase ThyX
LESHESFSPAEQFQLAPYVTNTERPVFVLTNLPEVIKGALFSRYSRSTLGLRTLLLQEFLQNSEAGFQATSTPQDSRLALTKAQSFYDRILDGYGDDSIGELGGAHLALEQVSILATTILEDARIGGSPLEKSTRYVSFAKQVNGDFQFYKDTRVLASAHAELYLQTNRQLFRTYAELIKPVRDYLCQVLPPEPNQPQAAYERSIRARGFDLLRALLPASTLTNVGIFGNGRFFEGLLIRLRLQTLRELQDLATAAEQELQQVVPSFIRRAAVAHRHYVSQQNFQQQGHNLIDRWIHQQAQDSATPQKASVELLSYDPEAEIEVLAALFYENSELSFAQARENVRGMLDQDRESLLRQWADLREHRRHKLGRALEHASYTFDIVADFGSYRDLHRHRILTQERQRLTTQLGYTIPESLIAAGLDSPVRDVLEKAARAFELLEEEFPKEAQYVVPMAYQLRWSLKINLRSLMWLVELRTTPQGHENYRWLAQQMFQRVQKVQPRLAQLIRFVNLEDYPLGRLTAEVKQELRKQSS